MPLDNGDEKNCDSVGVVLAVSTRDAELLERRVVGLIERLREHYRLRGETLRVEVIVSGDAVPWFLSGAPTVAQPSVERLAQWAAEGFVQVRVCEFTLADLQADPGELLPLIGRTPIAAAAVIDAQRSGCALLPSVH